MLNRHGRLGGRPCRLAVSEYECTVPTVHPHHGTAVSVACGFSGARRLMVLGHRRWALVSSHTSTAAPPVEQPLPRMTTSDRTRDWRNRAHSVPPLTRLPMGPTCDRLDMARAVCAESLAYAKRHLPPGRSCRLVGVVTCANSHHRGCAPDAASLRPACGTAVD
jgi:hypothetical protein